MVEHYTYSVAWSQEDGAYIATVAEFPSLAAHGAAMSEALQELQFVVSEVVQDLRASGEPVPSPLSVHRYSGKFNVRIPPSLHRDLAVAAAQAGVSLNQLVLHKLSR
jgi:predicted HicB family RNase H-like nuclease